MANEKTIKQLADELGVSKQTVQYHYKSLPAKGSKTNDKGIILLNSFGIKWLTDKIKRKTISLADKETTEESAKNVYPYASVFVDQLKEKDKQIMKLIENQEKLQKLLDQQQILTLQANKKIEELELKKESEEKIKSENDYTEEKNYEESEQNFPSTEVEKEKNNSTSFWKKFFRKEK